MEKILEQVKSFAEKAHGAQRRKYKDEPYIMHLVRVMGLIKKYSSSLPVLAAALLHDVLEDTPVRKNELHDFLKTIMSPPDADRTIKLVVDLTDIYTKANYPNWNRRRRREKEASRLAHTSAESQTIKYADIIDNSLDIVNADPDFAAVFLRECKMLLKKIQNGNPSLRQQAIDTVENELQHLRQDTHY
jgi:guanosine-3',5'-bis(diphosphate) 3'-pyrophosphohydrolase